jgi:CTP synthase
VLVAPGFGSRGIEGKLEAIKFVRENNIPFFGICLGMQCAVIEFGRNVLKLKGAHSTEMDEKSKYPVIDMREEQKNIKKKGGTMRLGSYICEIQKGTKAYSIYGKTKIKERHRHRYEFNNKFIKQYNDAGMITSGTNPDTGLVEMVELKNHPFFVASQFHPELKSTVANPHPIFVKFIEAAAEFKYGKKK